MKFWLIVFLLTADGEFVGKTELSMNSYEECLYSATQATLQYVNSGVGLATFCVSDDHKTGKKPDADVPLDF